MSQRRIKTTLRQARRGSSPLKIRRGAAPDNLPTAVFTDEDEEVATGLAMGLPIHLPGHFEAVGRDGGATPDVDCGVALAVVHHLRRGHEFPIGIHAAGSAFHPAVEGWHHKDHALVQDVFELVESLFAPCRRQSRENSPYLALVRAVGFHAHVRLRNEGCIPCENAADSIGRQFCVGASLVASRVPTVWRCSGLHRRPSSSDTSSLPPPSSETAAAVCPCVGSNAETVNLPAGTLRRTKRPSASLNAWKGWLKMARWAWPSRAWCTLHSTVTSPFGSSISSLRPSPEARIGTFNTQL